MLAPRVSTGPPPRVTRPFPLFGRIHHGVIGGKRDIHGNADIGSDAKRSRAGAATANFFLDGSHGMDFGLAGHGGQLAKGFENNKGAGAIIKCPANQSLIGQFLYGNIQDHGIAHGHALFGFLAAACPDIHPEMGQRGYGFPVLRLLQMDRHLAQNAGDQPLCGANQNPMTLGNLGIPAADG